MHSYKNSTNRDTLILIGLGLGLLIAYRASAQLPLTALGLAIFTPLALWRPDLALAYVPFSVALYFMPKGLFDARFGIRDTGIYLPLHEVVLLITAAGAALDWKRALRVLRNVSSAFVPTALFALAGLWGFLIAGEKGPALRELRWLVVEPLIFYGLLLVYAARGGAGYWRQMIGFWLAGGALAGLVGILQLSGLNLAPLIGIKAGRSEEHT
ncbi:MAG: polymerase, partial [Oscillochloris sp.]|nr:polymerase [Oscillochloris sp.]